MFSRCFRGRFSYIWDGRDTFESFKKSYSRGASPRLIAAFNAHSAKSKLRFEEGSRL